MILAFPTISLAQFVDNLDGQSAPSTCQTNVMKTTLCEVVADPDAFDGKMIELRADVFAGLEANLLYDKNCKLGQFPARIELVAKSAEESTDLL